MTYVKVFVTANEKLIRENDEETIENIKTLSVYLNACINISGFDSGLAVNPLETTPVTELVFVNNNRLESIRVDDLILFIQTTVIETGVVTTYTLNNVVFVSSLKTGEHTYETSLTGVLTKLDTVEDSVGCLTVNLKGTTCVLEREREKNCVK